MDYLSAREGRHPYKRQAAAERPSIFVFSMDMVAPDLYRQPSPFLEQMRMPNWQALAAESICFDNAFANSPLCGPSRAAMYTGRYPYIVINEERAHTGYELQVRPDDAIYPEYLKAGGYLTAHVGKSHIGVQKFADAFGEACSPWNRWAPPIWDDPEYHQYLRGMGVGKFRFSREIQGVKPDRRTPGNHYGGWLEQEDGKPFPIEATYPHYLVQRALAFLDSMLMRRRDEPLYLHVDLFAPHQPFLIPAGFEQREAELRASVELPDGYLRWLREGDGAFGPQPKVYRTYRRNWGLYQEETARDYLIAHILQMEVIDRALGTFIGGLRERGLYDEAMMVLTADHGEMNLEQGLIDKGVYGHPKIARVPLLWKLPENRRGGETILSPVSLLDLAPTFCEAAGMTPIARLDGESLYRRLDAPNAERARPFLWEAGWHIAPNPAIAIHRYLGPGDHYRYVYNLCSETDELYDLDAADAVNLINDPTYDAVRRDMLARLRDELSSDARWKCYWQAFTIDTYGEIPIESGDQQMFVPDH